MPNSTNPAKDPNKNFRNRKINSFQKVKSKATAGKRYKITLSITAGHIRSGHSYH